MEDIPKLIEEARLTGDEIVGDVERLEEKWAFIVRFREDKSQFRFVFDSRKEAYVSRRLMKEILASTAVISRVLDQSPFP